ncbi:unnamed protein product [Brassica napus]|uniref:Transcription repressor n=1 Tax=Brassica napus TaxID=3708 RepID=A0A817A7X6_BRANA|nr:unnamed protein product [Brassica napus]
MSSVKKKARDYQRETRGFLEVEAMDRDKGATVIMTPRIHVNRDKKRRDQKLLLQKPKRSEQESEVKVQKPATRTCTRSYSREDFVKLKEIKLREVKLKADQQRKSMYLRRELGTKENSKVRVFSPRACRVKAMEDLKKAKLRAREHDGGGIEKESFAVAKCSSDPQKDFRDSMVEMIMENGIINETVTQGDTLCVCFSVGDTICNKCKDTAMGFMLDGAVVDGRYVNVWTRLRGRGVCVDKRGVDSEVGDGRVVDRGCVYVDAFDKGVDRRTVGDRSVELSSILNIVNCPKLLYSAN